MLYTIVSYPELGSEKDKHVWHSKTKRGVVGILKLVMDNFDPKHVDILRSDE